MFLKLLANADSLIDFRRFIVELKSLKRYRNVFSLGLLVLVDLNVKKGKDFRVGAIFGCEFQFLCTQNCTTECTK